MELRNFKETRDLWWITSLKGILQFDMWGVNSKVKDGTASDLKRKGKRKYGHAGMSLLVAPMPKQPRLLNPGGIMSVRPYIKTSYTRRTLISEFIIVKQTFDEKIWFRWPLNDNMRNKLNLYKMLQYSSVPEIPATHSKRYLLNPMGGFTKSNYRFCQQ